MNENRTAKLVKLATPRREEQSSRVVHLSPELGVAAAARGNTPQEPDSQLPADFEARSVPAVMQRVRALASQI